MRKDGKSQYTIKKEKLLKIKKILTEEIPEKIRWKWTKDDLINHYQVNEYKIWELVKDEK